MENKIILITGASDGIGKETAKTLAKQGHTVIMHGRDKQKIQTAYEEIKAETGNNNIDYIVADFLSLAEVKTMAEEFKQKYDRLDVLINNAGAQFTDKRETNSEGHEKTMVVNLFAPFLLTSLLLNTLKKSKSARVVTVSSAAHSMSGKVDLSDIELNNNYTMAKSYAVSKLYVIWIMRRFALEMKKLGVENIAFNTVHPGSVETNLARESAKSLKFRIILFLWKPMMTTLAKAASSSIKAAVSPELERVSGKYFGLKGEENPNDKYYSLENEQIVWAYCAKIAEPYL